MYKLIGFLAFVTLVAANDLIVGHNDEGRKIVDEHCVASPAIWRQTANITYNASDSEVISRVVIIDMRSDKDGDVKIVEGGEGQKNVTIELKSPTVFRGYDFHIEVYAVADDNRHGINTEEPNLDATTKQDAPNVPISLSGDTLEDNSRKTRKSDNGDDSTTLKSIVIPTAVPLNPSTQAANDQKAPKPHDFKERNGENIPINIGKDEKQTVDVSIMSKINDFSVTLPNDATVQPVFNKSEVAYNDQKKTEGELKPALPAFNDDSIDVSEHEKFRSVRNSEGLVVEEEDYLTFVTGLSGNEATTQSAEVTSTIEADAFTAQSPSDTVTEKFKAPNSYNH